MSKLKTDSPVSRRIVASFLDFLNSVEPAPGVDLESLEVVKECLTEVFKIDPSSRDSSLNRDSLVEIFSSRGAVARCEANSSSGLEQLSVDSPLRSLLGNVDLPEASGNKDEVWTRDTHISGISKDELFGHLFSGLENLQYFKNMPDGSEDQVQLDRATHRFHNALEEMQKSGCEVFDQKTLAETFKTQGNHAMQSKQYFDAIELYTFAIAICEDNAVFYCNRAAAYTHLQKYDEAVKDCLKSIEIDPSYSKAYSRLGFAYYAQGKYRDALDRGFYKALMLDPGNSSVKENIRVAEQRLREEQQRAGHDQAPDSASHFRNSSQQSGSNSGNNGTPPPFGSIPLTFDGLPANIASMFMNVAGNAQQGQHSGNSSEAGFSFGEPHDHTGFSTGGNISVNFGEQMPEELTGALRSVMEMFSGASSQGHQEHNMSGRPGQS